jgi:glutamate dehydrogenase/leucine dehydrogenase
VIELGGVVLTLSDSTGTVVEEGGFTKEQVEQVRGRQGRTREEGCRGAAVSAAREGEGIQREGSSGGRFG